MIEVELTLPLLVVNMGVNQPRESGFVARLDHLGALRDLDRAFSSDRFNSSFLPSR